MSVRQTESLSLQNLISVRILLSLINLSLKFHFLFNLVALTNYYWWKCNTTEKLFGKKFHKNLLWVLVKLLLKASMTMILSSERTRDTRNKFENILSSELVKIKKNLEGVLFFPLHHPVHATRDGICCRFSSWFVNLSFFILPSIST